MTLLSKKTAIEQVKELLNNYTQLSVIECSDEKILISGSITINRKALDHRLYDDFDVEILIKINSFELPTIKETGGKVVRSYEHCSKNGELCLETDLYTRLQYKDGFSLLAWMENIVEPYFFSYDYFTNYHKFPFGERSHGFSGFIETCGELWNEENIDKSRNLLSYFVHHPYRGHVQCPCGSMKKLRDCHGEILLVTYNDRKLKDLICFEYSKWNKVANFDNRRIPEKTK